VRVRIEGQRNLLAAARLDDEARMNHWASRRDAHVCLESSMRIARSLAAAKIPSNSGPTFGRPAPADADRKHQSRVPSSERPPSGVLPSASSAACGSRRAANSGKLIVRRLRSPRTPSQERPYLSDVLLCSGRNRDGWRTSTKLAAVGTGACHHYSTTHAMSFSSWQHRRVRSELPEISTTPRPKEARRSSLISIAADRSEW